MPDLWCGQRHYTFAEGMLIVSPIKKYKIGITKYVTGSRVKTSKTIQKPTMLEALIPVVVLMSLLSLSVYLYGDNAQAGASQMSLLISGGVALLIGWKNNYQWRDIEKAISHGVGNTVNAY